MSKATDLIPVLDHDNPSPFHGSTFGNRFKDDWSTFSEEQMEEGRADLAWLKTTVLGRVMMNQAYHPQGPASIEVVEEDFPTI